MYREKLVRNNVIPPFSQLSIDIVTDITWLCADTSMFSAALFHSFLPMFFKLIYLFSYLFQQFLTINQLIIVNSRSHGFFHVVVLQFWRRTKVAHIDLITN